MNSALPTKVETVQAAASERTRISRLSAVVVVFKLRIVVLLLFAAIGGAMLGSGGAPSLGQMMLLILTGGLSAAGASALNQYLERYKDATMKRTRRRPLVTGELDSRTVLLVAALMVVLASGIALLAGNPMLALFLAVGAFIYVGIYTIWLKPRSVTNVVIGGAAGSAAVLAGGAAVGHWSDPGVLVLSLLLFAWSPTHFWSLALAYRPDYSRANVPMLPVVMSQRWALFWMLAHALVTGLSGLVLALHGALGWLYFVPVLLATAWLWIEAARLVYDYSGARALNVFKVSNLYLSIVLLAICVAALVA